MRALKQLFLLLVYGFIVYCLINFFIWGLILYIIGALIVWAANIKYDEIKIIPLRIKFPIITALLFLPLLGIIAVVDFFRYTFIYRD